jgi:hypothetical protein
MPSKTNPCLGASRDRKLASFNAQLTDAQLVCKGRPGGFAMANSLPLCGPVTGQPQVTVLRITIPSHTALHLQGRAAYDVDQEKRSNKPNDPFSKK